MPNRKQSQNPSRSSRQSKDGREALSKVSADFLRKLPPQDLDAEKSVLGGVFQSNNVFHNVVDTVSPDDFYSPGHKTIFQAFIDLYNKNEPIDLITVGNRLETEGTLNEVGGRVYLAELTEAPVSSANAARHAYIVREKAVLRNLIDVSADIIGRCYESTDVNELLDTSESAVFKIAESRTSSTIVPSGELIKQVYSELEARYARKSPVTGIRTGYTRFDEMTAGLQNSDLIILAGRPSMGKTAFGLNLALRAVLDRDEPVPTAIFSLEMSKEQLMTRMLAVQARVGLQGLRTGYIEDQDWLKLHDAADRLSAAPLFIDDTPALSTLELRARCRRLKAREDLGLIMVDYLQLMRSSRNPDSREQEISDISRNLKALAKELNIPVVALSQLNRRVEDRNPPKPMLADLRESGAIEQDADVILFIYREDAYRKKKRRAAGDDMEDVELTHVAEIDIGKQRNGPTGEFKLYFHDKYTAFDNLTETVPEPSEASV